MHGALVFISFQFVFITLILLCISGVLEKAIETWKYKDPSQTVHEMRRHYQSDISAQKRQVLSYERTSLTFIGNILRTADRSVPANITETDKVRIVYLCFGMNFDV